MKYFGTIIKESLKTDSVLPKLSNQIIEKWTAENRADFQPEIWTAIHFTNQDDSFEELASLLCKDIKEKWYCNFQTENTVFVIFKDKIFQYLKNDSESINIAKKHGILNGIPEAQLDW